jgi:hypothetical protein
MIRTLSTSLPPISPRNVLILTVVAVLSVPNAILLSEAFGFMATRDYVFDWWLFGEASARIGTGTMYDWGVPGQFNDIYDYRYSPLFAYLITPFTWLGIWVWRALHIAALLLLPRRLALLTLLAWPFWLDVAHANVMTFAAVSGFLALRGSRWGTVAYVLIAMLVPRPVYVPLLVWIAWKRPEWRIPMLGMAGAYAVLTLATGEGFAFLASLTRGTELMALEYNWGPSALLGPVWLMVGVPLGAWLTAIGRVGLAGIVVSPHVLPYYLLVLLWELDPSRPPSAGGGTTPSSTGRSHASDDQHAGALLPSDGPDQPTISVIVPARNEVATIRDAIMSVASQTRAPDEIIVVEGRSDDGTLQVLRDLENSVPNLRVIDNPARTIPHGLNAGLAQSTGQVVARADGHSILPANYLELLVPQLSASRWAVGGAFDARGRTVTGEAAAHALHSGFGAAGGASRLRLRSSGPVDGVPFGVFQRAALERVGAWDTDLEVGEDEELFQRLRDAGGVIWCDPSVRFVYVTRDTWTGLLRQFWRWGFYKVRAASKRPGLLRPRHAAPATLVITLLVSAALLPWSWVPLAVAAGSWLVVASAAAIRIRERRAPWPAIVLAFAAMHLGYGSGTLAALLWPQRK